MGIFVLPNKYLVLLLLFCELSGSKRIASPDINGSLKLNECKRCKVLTDSFTYWLDKTSRGKYEGGDAAWEEAKLKSYSRSEIRLVEIQEGLCSEVKTYQDACYAIAEEAEQVLENWWFHKDPSVDLYTFLCIESLQHCCPSIHFGAECTLCPQDKNNKVCSGHGRCDGAGTRKGNGTCICKKGYSGELCDECAKNYYLTSAGVCNVCHKSCDGCNGEDAEACVQCNAGWQSQSGVCVDVNECETSNCAHNEYCVNSEGSYSCKGCELSCKTCIGEGSLNCTSCEPSTVLWFGMCIENQLKQNLVTETYKRLTFYFTLLIIIIYMVRKSQLVASIIALIIAMFIYFSEKNLRMTSIDILMQIWHEST